MQDYRLELPQETYDLINAMSIRSNTSMSTIIREILFSTPYAVNLEIAGVTERYKVQLETELTRENIIGILNWRTQKEKPALEKWRDSFKIFQSPLIEGVHYLGG